MLSPGPAASLPSKVKAVAPGGSTVVEPESDPVGVGLDSAEPVGVMLQMWWIAEPRQLCRILVPWDRTVVVTGDKVIKCRSHD